LSGWGRTLILDIFEMVTGARMMMSYFRPGGLAWDIPDGFEDVVASFIDLLPSRIDEYEALLTDNPIWRERTQGVGVVDAETAKAMSVTGPILRATGVAWDLRKTMPYSVYSEFEFDVPVGTHGDVFDRYQVRMQEMRESIKIIRQALDKLPGGPHRVDNHKVAPPPKEEIYLSITCRLSRTWLKGAWWRT